MQKFKNPNNNSNNNNNSSHDNKGDIFLFNIWRNIVIKNKILQYLRFINNKYFKIKINSKDELLNFRFRNQIDHLIYNVDQDISEGLIPSSVSSLAFGRVYNRELSIGSIPSSVRSLTFGTRFNKQLSVGSIPSSVKSLTFGSRFNQVITESLIPSSVISLSFGTDFNKALSVGSIPSSVKSLTFGGFDQVISVGIKTKI